MSDIDLFARQENEVLKKEKHELQHKIIDLRQSKEELQQKIDKAIKIIDEMMYGVYSVKSGDCVINYWESKCCNARLKIVKEILGDKENE